MATKAVNLSKEAYDRLDKLKLNEKESFSSVILRITPRFKPLMKLLRHMKRNVKGITSPMKRQKESLVSGKMNDNL